MSGPFFAPRNVRVAGILSAGRLPSFRRVGKRVTHQLTHGFKISGNARSVMRGLGGRCGCRISSRKVGRLLSGNRASGALFALSGRSCANLSFGDFTASFPEKLGARISTFILGAMLSCRGKHLRRGCPTFQLLVRRCGRKVLLFRVDGHRI